MTLWQSYASNYRDLDRRGLVAELMTVFSSMFRKCGGTLVAVIVALAAVAPLLAQSAAPAPFSKSEAQKGDWHDPLGRDTPQETVVNFLEACHARQYSKAAHYLDLRQLPLSEREKQGDELARQLEDLLDDTPFDIATLSRNTDGDLDDGLAPGRERLLNFRADGQTLELQLDRVELERGRKVWLVSADSVPIIPRAHHLIAETPLEKKLPQALVQHELLDTPLWRWIFLVAAGILIWFAAGLAARGIALLIQRFTVLERAHADTLLGPLRLFVAASGFRAVMEFAPPSAIVRLYLERGVGLLIIISLAWAAAAVVDMVAERWRSRLDPRMRAMTYSVLPLGRQIIKLLLFLFAILTVLSMWGYNTNTLLAGLGVGGLAVALAAQKTIENLFGGLSVIGDRPVLVGDFCRFGNRVGNVIHIGLRSTRIRTLDRTIVSVPNSQFSTMELENFSARDKMWFHPTLRLRRDTNSNQLRQVVNSVRDVLEHHPKVETGNLPVRFIGIGDSSLDIEVFAYVATPDFDEFLKIQQELLLDLMRVVERAGTGLAVPIVANVPFEHLAAAS
jgi:MscS family membrane protein